MKSAEKRVLAEMLPEYHDLVKREAKRRGLKVKTMWDRVARSGLRSMKLIPSTEEKQAA